MNKLRMVLALHLLFFLAWGGYLINSHKGDATQTVWLETLPVDPRDLLSGHYVSLRFAANRPQSPSCRQLLKAQAPLIYLELVPTHKTLPVEGEAKPVTLWKAGQCRSKKPFQGQGKWIKGSIQTGSWGGRHSLGFGIERFYVPEGSNLRQIGSGEVVAKVSINSRHIARIEMLAKIIK